MSAATRRATRAPTPERSPAPTPEPTSQPAAPGSDEPAADGDSGLMLPAGALVLLVGPSGCGKSSWAARHVAASEVLSSDGFRELVAGDAADQSAGSDAFRLLHLAAAARLGRGLRTVIDATNLSARSRAALRRIAARTGRPAVAVAFDMTLALCLSQNAVRPGRRVPDEIVRQQHRRMGEVLAALPTEGYAAVHVIRGAGPVGGLDLPPPGQAAHGVRPPTVGPRRAEHRADR